ncbi:Plastocyanin-like domain [Musa troglodytarum]|uniref:Plastocyanin-like domain n=1 Tax=Musa troglodytarum TaxID=320322 RepID=A0A9E7HS71_9LILI|nr:Plastocyanin-like domain [Musa troglodytarum]
MGKAVLLVLVCVSYHLSCASAFNRFSVGDEKGWIPGVNYTIWEKKHRPFHVGDWLVFYYQPRTADVVQVDEDAYDKCDASNPVSNYSKGRSYAFELNHTGHYYFICSYGYCYEGMKLSILVEPLTSPSAPLSAKKKSSASAAPPRALTSTAALAATLLAAALLRVL